MTPRKTLGLSTARTCIVGTGTGNPHPYGEAGIALYLHPGRGTRV